MQPAVGIESKARRRSAVALAAILAGACAAPPVPAPPIAGMAMGAPQRCVPLSSTGSLRIVDRYTISYASGAALWVNRLAMPCAGVSGSDIPVMEPGGAEYCRGDVVRTIDHRTGIPGPTCVLGDFVPYRR